MAGDGTRLLLAVSPDGTDLVEELSDDDSCGSDAETTMTTGAEEWRLFTPENVDDFEHSC